MKKRFLSVLMCVAVLCSVMAIGVSAANQYTVHDANLNQGYKLSPTKDNRTYKMEYGVDDARSYTAVQWGGGANEKAKAYAALMERGLLGIDGDFCQASSEIKNSNGYAEALARGDTNKANYVLHSGTSNVTLGWRFDHRYE